MTVADSSSSINWSLVGPALAIEVVVLVLVSGVWLWVWRRNAVHSGPHLAELAGDEPPAVVNLLVHGMKVSVEAAAATLLDLAARGHIEVDEINSAMTLVHVRDPEHRHRQEFLPHERRVLDELARLEVDGVVPAEACNLGPEDVSWRWWRRFATDVGDEAVQSGLADRGFVSPAFLSGVSGLSWFCALLFVLVIIPPFLLVNGSAHTNEPLAWLLVCSYVVPLSAVCSTFRIKYVTTAEGRAIATRWLGTREWLSEAEFDQHPPAAVQIWGRPLAYAIALGLAPHSARGLPFSAEDDVHAWSAARGSWHPIRIRYPMWIPGWGRPTGRVLLTSIGVAVVTVAAGIGMWNWRAAPGGRPTGVVLFVVAVLATALALIALLDLGPGVTVEGEIIRLRARFPDLERGLLTIVIHHPRWFVAIDNSRSRIHAISIREHDFELLREGNRVRITASRLLKYARRIAVIDEADDTEYVVRGPRPRETASSPGDG